MNLFPVQRDPDRGFLPVDTILAFFSDAFDVDVVGLAVDLFSGSRPDAVLTDDFHCFLRGAHDPPLGGPCWCLWFSIRPRFRSRSRTRHRLPLHRGRRRTIP